MFSADNTLRFVEPFPFSTVKLYSIPPNERVTLPYAPSDRITSANTISSTLESLILMIIEDGFLSTVNEEIALFSDLR